MHFKARAVSPEDFAAWAKSARQRRARRSTRRPTSELEKQGLANAGVQSARRRASCSTTSSARKYRRRPGPTPTPRPSPIGGLHVLGKLSWDAIPLDPADPAGRRRGVVVRRRPRRAGLRRREGLGSLSLARMDHQRRSQAHRRDVCAARLRHAAARLHRRADDAVAAGARVSAPAAICRPSTTTRYSPRTARS